MALVLISPLSSFLLLRLILGYLSRTETFMAWTRARISLLRSSSAALSSIARLSPSAAIVP